MLIKKVNCFCFSRKIIKALLVWTCAYWATCETGVDYSVLITVTDCWRLRSSWEQPMVQSELMQLSEAHDITHSLRFFLLFLPALYPYNIRGMQVNVLVVIRVKKKYIYIKTMKIYTNKRNFTFTLCQALACLWWCCCANTNNILATVTSKVWGIEHQCSIWTFL